MCLGSCGQALEKILEPLPVLLGVQPDAAVQATHHYELRERCLALTHVAHAGRHHDAILVVDRIRLSAQECRHQRSNSIGITTRLPSIPKSYHGSPRLPTAAQ